MAIKQYKYAQVIDLESIRCRSIALGRFGETKTHPLGGWAFGRAESERIRLSSRLFARELAMAVAAGLK
jgi:hypothetical protein